MSTLESRYMVLGWSGRAMYLSQVVHRADATRESRVDADEIGKRWRLIDTLQDLQASERQTHRIAGAVAQHASGDDDSAMQTGFDQFELIFGEPYRDPAAGAFDPDAGHAAVFGGDGFEPSHHRADAGVSLGQRTGEVVRDRLGDRDLNRFAVVIVNSVPPMTSPWHTHAHYDSS